MNIPTGKSQQTLLFDDRYHRLLQSHLFCCFVENNIFGLISGYQSLQDFYNNLIGHEHCTVVMNCLRVSKNVLELTRRETLSSTRGRYLLEKRHHFSSCHHHKHCINSSAYAVLENNRQSLESRQENNEIIARSLEINRLVFSNWSGEVLSRISPHEDIKHQRNPFSVNGYLYQTSNPYFSTRRHFTTSITRFSEPSSKVEQTVNALKEEVEQQKKPQDKPETVVDKKTAVTTPPKRPLRKRIWDELVHYYHGFRLLFIDIRIASRLAWKSIQGEDLSRREYRQLTRTTADIFRLVPFSIFIIVPFMEFLLPVFLKFFPGMLPSTFQTAKDRDTKIKQQLKVKLDMTKFLQTTLDEMALQSKGTEHHSHAAKEFAEFFQKIRQSGEMVSNDSILKFSKLFEDEITLDSLSRPQLTALCRLLELKPMGPDNLLRFQLRMQLKSLKSDDMMIQKEGVSSLTVPELQQACRARGMRALGVAEDRLRAQLGQWLELSLNEKIPPSLLLLSRVLYLPESLPAPDQLKATIQSLPLEVGTEAKYKIGETEGKIDNRTRLEMIKQEEAAIKKEQEDVKKEKAVKQAAASAATEAIIDNAKVLVDKAPELSSKEDIESLEQALDQVGLEKHSLAVEKEELEDLKEEMADYKEDIEEFKEMQKLTGKRELTESKAAKALRKRVDKMINKMDGVMLRLEAKKEKIQEKIDSMKNEPVEGVSIQQQQDNLVNINELLTSIRSLQTVHDEDKLKSIVDVLDSMDADHDGKVDVEHVVKVIEVLGREDVNLSSDQMKDIVKQLIREEEQKEKEKITKTSESDLKKDDKSAQNSKK